MIGYRLGTLAGGLAGLQYLEDIGLSVIPFPTPYQPWAVVYPVANGATYGDGSPICQWVFSWMTMFDMALMLGYIGAGNQSTQVCLSTKDDLDVWLNKTAYIHRPTYPREGNRRPGKYWRNVTFRFTQLETLT